MRTLFCSDCKQDLPTERFSAARVTPGAKRGTCKPCVAHRSRELRRTNRRPLQADPTTMIFCPECEQTMQLEHFAQSQIRVGMRRARCRKCASRLALEYNRAHQDQHAANLAKHRATGRPLERQRERYATDSVRRNKVLAINRKWKLENPEKYKQSFEKWRRENMSRILLSNYARSAGIRRARAPWANIAAIKSIYAEARRLTRETGVRYEVDHIYPLKGKLSSGLHVEHNLRIITGTENRKKLNKMPEEITC